MKYTTHAFLPALLLACACASAGCNSIFGIEAPEDAVLYDSGTPEPDDGDPSPVPDAGGGGNEPDDVDASTPVAIDGGTPIVAPNDGNFATWPMPNPTATGLDHLQAYAISTEGVVTDKVTHLEWQQFVDAEASTWQEAATYCEKLALEGDGYRLPTRIELLSLLDFTVPSPSIDGVTFPATPPDFFWSSSRFVGDTSIAWLVNFSGAGGFLSSSDLRSMFYVRCVRDAADVPSRQFEAAGATVRDSATKLVWQRASSDETLTFPDAISYCDELDLDGGSWRLPTTKELQTLVDEKRAMPAIDRRAFPSTASDFYWTASSVAEQTEQLWAVSFRFGFDSAFKSDTQQHVRCVK
jgi:hypothetical protein